MKKLNIRLQDQLIIICVFIVFVMLISLGIILPKMLMPIYEDNIYRELESPLAVVRDNVDDYKLDNEIAYIYMVRGNIVYSDNLSSIIDIDDINDIIDDINNNHGKFTYHKNTYYYSTRNNTNGEYVIALTDDTYINGIKYKIWSIISIVVGISFIIISLVMIIWSNHLVNKIRKLKDKIDNLDNDDYDFNVYNYCNDEFYTLDMAISNMRNYLKEQEEYKNNMYQNISHDFKTPIAVIKSYIEAYEDNMEDVTSVINITKEQVDKLEIKVHSLLYLNKLNYIRDKKEFFDSTYDVSITVDEAINKFKNLRPDVQFLVDIDKKNCTFRGSSSMWEAIIDNILNNFMRYAKTTIKITIKNKKIILYNDGDNIKENVLDNIFTPYEKGIHGVFGLGLSIVKKTLKLLNYDITIKNTKDGVKFIIY